MIELAKMDAPPGYIHVANDSKALIEQEAIDNYHEFYHEHIDKEEFIVLKHDKMRGCWAIFVPVKYESICKMADDQVRNMLDTFKKYYWGNND